MPIPTPPATAAAPTPTAEYKLSEHAPDRPAPRNPDLAAALARRAGTAQGQAARGESTTQEAKVIPSQPPRPPLEQEPKAQAPAPEEPKAPTKFVSADDVEPAAPAPEPAKAPGEPAPDVLKGATAALREAYEKLKADFTTKATEGEMTRKQLAEFKAKAQSYEDRIKVLESADTRAKELEKQVLTYDEQLRVTNYLQHPEFHEKYVRPVAEAVQSAHAMVKELMIQGENRMGNEEDFAAVLAQPNNTLAAEKAAELFGERMGVTVFEEARRVKQAQQAQSRAVKEAGLKSQEWMKQQQERATLARTEARSTFEKAAAQLAEKYPQLYKAPDGDKDAAAARASGEELAKLIVEGRPEEMSVEDYLNAVAKLYHRAASFPMRELAISRLQTEVEQLRGRLAAYEKSTPDASSLQRPGGVVQDAGGTIVTSRDNLSAQMRASLERRAGSRR